MHATSSSPDAIHDHLAQIDVEGLAVARGDKADRPASGPQVGSCRLSLIAKQDQQVSAVFPAQLLREGSRRGVAVEDMPFVEDDDRECEVVNDRIEQCARQDLTDHGGF